MKAPHILYIKAKMVFVRLSVRLSDDVLGAFSVAERPQRFSMAEPATETMTIGYQRPRS
jgi:hypothetical protein